MFDYKRAGLSTATTGFLFLIASLMSFALDYRVECTCDGWETCCETNVEFCGQDLCLCKDAVLTGESDEAYCSNKSVMSSFGPAFWIGYYSFIAAVLLLKLGIVLCIAGACLERDRLRSQTVMVPAQPLSKAPGKGETEHDSLVC